MVYLIHQIYAYTIRCETCLGTFIKHVDNSKKRLEGKIGAKRKALTSIVSDCDGL
jgi:hypothetical protein